MEEAHIRKHLVFSGAVQGVGLRWRARLAAQALGVTGWVCNEPDGSVSMELQGSEAQLDQVLESLEASRYIQIDRVESRRIPLQPGERDFVTLDDRW